MKKFILGVLGCLALFLAMNQGNLQTSPLSTLLALKGGFLQQEQVVLSVRALNAEESKEHLQGDIVHWGYQPVQVTIENNSPDPYFLSPESIELPLIHSKKVANHVVKNSIPRAIGFKIASFLFWPFMIPSTIDSLMTLKSYNALKKSLASKIVKEEIIPPYSVVNRLFFVKIEDYQDSYVIKIQNQETLEDKVFQLEKGDDEGQKTISPTLTEIENYYLSHEK